MTVDSIYPELRSSSEMVREVTAVRLLIDDGKERKTQRRLRGLQLVRMGSLRQHISKSFYVMLARAYG